MDDDLYAYCVACGDEYDSRRRDVAGFDTCPACGDKAARREASLKSRACVPMHKGNYVYVGQGPTAMANVLAISNMRRQG